MNKIIEVSSGGKRLFAGDTSKFLSFLVGDYTRRIIALQEERKAIYSADLSTLIETARNLDSSWTVSSWTARDDAHENG